MNRKILIAAMSGAHIPSWVLHGGGPATIDLDFAGNRYYGGTLSSLLSCSRASGGYGTNADGTLTWFGPNTLRQTTQGLLIEEGRTNLATYSQDFSNGWWYKNYSSVTANVTTAPDGTLTGNKIVETADTGEHGIFVSTTISNATIYTESVYLKAAERNFAYIRTGNSSTGDGGIFINLTTGAVTGTFGSIVSSYSVTPSVNGWWRLSITYTSNNTQGGVNFATSPDGATRSFAGTAGFGIYAWGAQLEQGAFPTSYIPTTTGSVLRNADNVTAAGALLSAFQGPSWSVTVGTTLHSVVASMAVIGGNASFTLAGFTSSSAHANFWNGAVNLITANVATVDDVTVSKIGVGYSAAGRSIVLNNGAVVSDANTIAALTSVSLSFNSSSAFLNSYVKRLSTWSSRLPDATLKSLTA